MTRTNLENILLFLTLLFLPTQLGRHFWPDFSFVYSLKIDYLSPTVYFWDLLVVLLLIVWVWGKPQINKTALNLLFIFLLTQAASLFMAKNQGAGLTRLEQYLVSGLLGVYLASLGFERLKGKIFLPLFLGITLESALAVGQFVKGEALGLWLLGERSFSLQTPAIAKFDFNGLIFLRPYGTFSHPNVLAAYLLIAISLVWMVKPKGLPTIFVSFLAGWSILLTVARVAVFSFVFLLLFRLKSLWFWVLILGLLVLSPIFYTRFSSLFNFDNLALLRREELAISAWSLFLSAPFFGVGLNNFITALANDVVAGPSRFLQPVHNIFLLTMAETGIIGLLGALALVGWPIVKLWTLIPRSSTWHPILLLWGIVIFLGLFDHYFLTLAQGQRMLFLVWGLSFASLRSVDV